MSDETQKITEKSTSERLAEIIPQLSKDQMRFVIACQDFPTKKSAAEAIGLESDTVYRWPPIVDEAIRLVAIDSLSAAKTMLTQSLAKAMQVKLAGLDVEDETLRQRVATEIIEWQMGKAVQQQNVKLDGKIEIELSFDEWE